MLEGRKKAHRALLSIICTKGALNPRFSKEICLIGEEQTNIYEVPTMYRDRTSHFICYHFVYRGIVRIE